MVIGLLSLLWIRAGWDYGLQFQGFRYTLITAIGSAVFAIACGVILASPERTNSFTWSFTANFLIFVWLVTYAFPSLGELP